jgi:hypothetical protein
MTTTRTDTQLQALAVGLLARIADQRDEDARRSRRSRMLLGMALSLAYGGRRR